MKQKSKEFKKLQQEWYEKLAKSGFEDIETDEQHLETWSNMYSYRIDLVKVESKQEYFRRAGQFLFDRKFKNKIEKFIWASHADGISIRNIVKLLGKKGVVVYRNPVHLIIKRLRAEMIKQYVTK